MAEELLSTWRQLEATGYLSDNVLSHATTGLAHNNPLKYLPGDSVPGLKYNKTAALIFGSANNSHSVGQPAGWELNTPTIYIAANILTGWSQEGVIKPSDAEAMDIKIDDGLYDTGNMYSSSSGGGVAAQYQNCVANLAGWRYNYQYDDELHGCRIHIKATNY
jgi:hypothetical protein